MTSQKNQKLLLEWARKSIELTLDDKSFKPDKIPEELKEKRGVFVTLTIDGQLRGCIGTIKPVSSIYEAVLDNAINAAFNDPRFEQLSKEEFEKLHIEISILTNPKKLEYKDSNDLLKKITHNDGLIIRKGFNSATFLPQVWEDLPDKESFLSHLCMKAGLSQDAWKKDKLEVQLYQVEKFEE